MVIESYMLYNNLDGDSDQWTCAINGPGSYEGDMYWLECADIASATTMSNTFDPEDEQAVRSVNYSTTNQFGGDVLCPAHYGENELARVGDGMINGFDVSALLW